MSELSQGGETAGDVTLTWRTRTGPYSKVPSLQSVGWKFEDENEQESSPPMVPLETGSARRKSNLAAYIPSMPMHRHYGFRYLTDSHGVDTAMTGRFGWEYWTGHNADTDQSTVASYLETYLAWALKITMALSLHGKAQRSAGRRLLSRVARENHQETIHCRRVWWHFVLRPACLQQIVGYHLNATRM